MPSAAERLVTLDISNLAFDWGKGAQNFAMPQGNKFGSRVSDPSVNGAGIL